MNKTYKEKAFTLIELLVVIAIIGILASVVLSSLNSAKVKARDAFVKETLSSIRTDAQTAYDTNNGSYSIVPSGVSVCSYFGNPDIDKKIAGIIEKSGFASCWLLAGGQKYVIIARSPIDSRGWYYCIDYRGQSIKEPIYWGTTNDGDCDLNNVEE